MRTKLILILIIIALLTITTAYIAFQKIQKLEKDNANLKIEMTVKTDSIHVFVNSENEEITTVEEYEKNFKELKNSKDSIERKLHKETAKLNLKEKEINSLKYAYIVASNTIQGESKTDTIYKDTLIFIKHFLSFDDGYLSAILADSTLEYQYTEELFMLDLKRTVDRQFPPWRWIGWKKIIDKNKFDVRSSNPKAKIKVLRTIKI